ATTDAVQRSVTGRLYSGPGLASLAGFGAGRISVSGLERVIFADDVRGGGHFSGREPAHHGHWRAINGAPGADDAGTAGGRLADHPLRLDHGHRVRPAELFVSDSADDSIPMADD